MQVGAGEGGRGVGQVADGVEAAVAGGLPRGVQAGGLLVERGVARRVGVRQVRPDRDDLRGAVGLGLGGGVEQVGPFGGLHAVAGEPGVDLEVQPGRAARLSRARQHGGEVGAGGDGEVDVGGHRGGEVVVGDVQPGEHPDAEPRGAQLQGLLDRADAQPGGARRERGTGDRDGAVPVAVGLDHHHQRGVGCGGAQHVDVVPDGGEIDERLGARAVHPRILSSDYRAASRASGGRPGWRPGGGRTGRARRRPRDRPPARARTPRSPPPTTARARRRATRR